MPLETDMEKRHIAIRFTALKMIFGFGFLFYMVAGHIASAQISPLDRTIEITLNNSSDIRVLKEQVFRNSKDIETMSATINELAASINRFTGIGIAIGALGGVIVVLQALTLVKKRP